MKVNISGRHVTVNAELESYAREKAEKLDKYFSGIQRVDFVLDHNGKDVNMVEMSVILGQGATLHGKAEATDMKSAVDGAAVRLKSTHHSGTICSPFQLPRLR